MKLSQVQDHIEDDFKRMAENLLRSETTKKLLKVENENQHKRLNAFNEEKNATIKDKESINEVYKQNQLLKDQILQKTENIKSLSENYKQIKSDYDVFHRIFVKMRDEYEGIKAVSEDRRHENEDKAYEIQKMKSKLTACMIEIDRFGGNVKVGIHTPVQRTPYNENQHLMLDKLPAAKYMGDTLKSQTQRY